ncbi:MAG: hypothetical protein Q9222_005436 [Ikaeria aurantiellina]
MLPVSNKVLKSGLQLPSRFLEGPAPDITVSRIRFEETAVPELGNLYATVLGNVITLSECAILIEAIDSQRKDTWENIVGNDNGDGHGFLPENRMCQRLMWDSPELVSKIWERIADKVPEVQELKNWPQATCPPCQVQSETWKVVRLNERVRFMKDSHGDCFKRLFPRLLISKSASRVPNAYV